MKLKNRVLCVVGFLILVAALVYSVSLRLGNPDMTQTRLWMTFWREYLGVTLAFIVGYFMITVANE